MRALPTYHPPGEYFYDRPISCLASLMQTVRKATIMTRFLAPTETRSSGFQNPVNFPPPAKYKFMFGQSERHHQSRYRPARPRHDSLSSSHVFPLGGHTPAAIHMDRGLHYSHRLRSSVCPAGHYLNRAVYTANPQNSSLCRFILPCKVQARYTLPVANLSNTRIPLEVPRYATF